MKYTHKFVTHNKKTNKFKWTACAILENVSGQVSKIKTRSGKVMEYNTKQLCRIYDLDPPLNS